MSSHIRVTNMLTRRTEDFVPVSGNQVRIYVCGPTVQSAPHLGHGRAAVAFDMIRRYLVYRGYDVTFVRNITDVEDKIIAAAAETGETTEELSARVAKAFGEAYDGLAVLEPDVEPKATEHIPEMLEMIERLIDRGLAYPTDAGDVYYSVRMLESYGRLSGQDVDEMRAGTREIVGDLKHDPVDFAVWKAAKPGEPAWDSPWGPGRPGWHIECSAMAQRYLGETFDIHGGGTDLIFPHHENEIAQSEGANGVPFAKYWLHNGMVNLGGEKMAKSTGHLIGLAEAIEQFGGDVVRLFYLRAHYRSPLEFSEALMDEARTSLGRISKLLDRVDYSAHDAEPEVIESFIERMDDDFNTPEALALVFDTVKEANRRADAGGSAASLAAAVAEMLDVLGIDIEDTDSDLSEVSNEVRVLAAALGVEAGVSTADTLDRLLERRSVARAERDFGTSDRIRDELASIGISIEDGADGSQWHRR
ncbi:MAG: cysteine--tRNA ligase [Acidimicrobiia bacterium]|nr:cysteine--tRNA ligase [Acidimicrobiia bacterium]